MLLTLEQDLLELLILPTQRKYFITLFAQLGLGQCFALGIFETQNLNSLNNNNFIILTVKHDNLDAAFCLSVTIDKLLGGCLEKTMNQIGAIELNSSSKILPNASEAHASVIYGSRAMSHEKPIFVRKPPLIGSSAFVR